MPLLNELHRYIKKRPLRPPADDPGLGYLLGFDIEEEKRQPIKTYIRQLWLAFQSGPGSMPRCFLDDKSTEFSKEIDEWVSDYANDPNLLAEEVAKDPVVVDRRTTPIQIRSAFMEDTAHTLLVTRDWGEQLWGHRKYCVAPLANAKAKKGEESPAWPRDRETISMAVRRWIAARLQEKLNNPVERKWIPRVPCPENPAERRESIAARFAEIERYDSGEETEAVAEFEVEEVEEVEEVAEVDAVEEVVPEESEQNAAQPPCPQTPEEQRKRRRSTRQRKPSRRVIDGQQSLLSRDVADFSLDQADYPADERRTTRKRALRYANFIPDLRDEAERSRSLDSYIDRRFPDASDAFLSAQSASKRKRNEQQFPSKRSKAAPDSEEPRGPLPTPATSICIAQLPSEDDRISPTPNIAPSMGLVDVESFGTDCNTLPAPKALVLQQDGLVADKAVRQHENQSFAANGSLHPQKPSRSGWHDVVLLPSPEESSPLESTRALGTAPTLEHDRAKEGRLDFTSYTPANLDIDFDQYADPSADDSQLDVSQDRVSAEVVPETQHLPLSSNEAVSIERQGNLPMPVQSSPRNGQPFTKLATALSHGHQKVELKPCLPPLRWENPDLNILRRMVNSLVSVLDGSLTYEYMVDCAVISVQKSFETATKDLQEPEETALGWPVRILIHHTAEFAILRRRSRLNQIIGSDKPCASPVRDYDSTALFSKLDELAQWFISRIPKWSDGCCHLKLAACHDMKILFEESLLRKPDYESNEIVFDTLQAYSKLHHHLWSKYISGEGGLSLGDDDD
ncbi:uncharacterized protein EKO05_0003251 [Ascochyta rabiei]|uniref:uncharacterized protein n=1 Tax=Didymella rabiei TaxID=5454 RepID=UPI0019026840|nr:uncharacterized protein EKO05_0003251 [Ascochyta rabiei]UPX12712.1 hypothetical protein EKO05_0003251 [Ascochyta rabiei]